jgi:hypothetical protein
MLLFYTIELFKKNHSSPDKATILTLLLNRARERLEQHGCISAKRTYAQRRGQIERPLPFGASGLTGVAVFAP